MNEDLIAPCGMNCGVCQAHLRDNNPCPGCRANDPNKPKTRTLCKIKNCPRRKGEFCFDCNEFPCERLRHIDERYRKKYDMSEIENLKTIQKDGIDKFIESQTKKYVSDRGVFCIHDKKYYKG